jgi:hypothetical protein
MAIKGTYHYVKLQNSSIDLVINCNLMIQNFVYNVTFLKITSLMNILNKDVE